MPEGTDHPMTASDRPAATLRVAVANLEFGGLSEAGDDSAWAKSMACLRRWMPQAVLLQELNGRQGVHRLQAHLWRTANELGMIPVLGPPSPDSVSGNHPAVLVRTGIGMKVLDAGPLAWPAGAAAPAWCEALVAVPGLPHPVWFISAHLPARSATSQAIQAERLANLAAQRGGLVVAGGDWNSYTPADADLLTPAVLQELPLHLRPARLRPALDGGPPLPDHRVHAALASVGLTDAAAELPPARRTPPGLTATGAQGRARVDRIYVTSSLVPALTAYEQAATGGSDHQALLLTLGTAAAAAAVPPPPLP
jgi:endonuclease/exonuclease/phosphatase family metal-dependent hydrolase